MLYELGNEEKSQVKGFIPKSKLISGPAVQSRFKTSRRGHVALTTNTLVTFQGTMPARSRAPKDMLLWPLQPFPSGKLYAHFLSSASREMTQYARERLHPICECIQRASSRLLVQGKLVQVIVELWE